MQTGKQTDRLTEEREEIKNENLFAAVQADHSLCGRSRIQDSVRSQRYHVDARDGTPL